MHARFSDTLDAKLLRRSLNAFFATDRGWDFEEIVAPSTSKFRLCLLRADNPDLGVSVVIKANKQKEKNLQQFKTLKAFETAGVPSVKPHFIDDDQRFFVMDWIESPLIASRLGGRDHSKLISETGEWLSRLQKATLRKNAKSSKLHRPKMRRVSGDKTVEKLSAPLKKRLKDRRIYQTGTVRLHGDYTITNIFATSDGVVGFDPQFDAFGSPFEDAARLLLSLAEARYLALLGDKRWPGTAETDRRDLFEGYGPIRADDLWVFDLFEDYTYFSKWRRQRSRDPKHAIMPFLNEELEKRGLLDGETRSVRPGRLIIGPEAETADWTNDVSIAPRKDTDLQISKKIVPAAHSVLNWIRRARPSGRNP